MGLRLLGYDAVALSNPWVVAYELRTSLFFVLPQLLLSKTIAWTVDAFHQLCAHCRTAFASCRRLFGNTADIIAKTKAAPSSSRLLGSFKLFQ